MAKKLAVWGIDIGQFALKALRCTLDADGNVVADKFDFIEYPKILSSPEADAEELIQDALKQFLSRNNVLGDKVAISVSGQAGLSRFFKPPPVEVKTLPDIVKYEVKQQIPFPIEDVIWDWQQMGGTVVDGRAVDAEVGLFAMKRDAVYRALRPFTDADIDVDILQLAPLALFNYASHDVLENVPKPEDYDPDNPPPSTVVMAVGTDTTDLVVTNGIKLWLRSIPIGGSHFTRQLSRELKLTQAKAEHLKRNARQSENPKAVFQAMRPVFNDLVNEVQRSLTFFQSMEKSATISEIILLGNAAKLPGLRQFLNTQLEIDIAKSSEFNKLGGTEVTKQSTFQENLLSYASCYGLCVQGLNKGAIDTNLLPEEIVVERVIEAKKPWVLAAVGALMLGLVFGLFFKANKMYLVNPNYKDSNNTTWNTGFQRVSTEDRKSKGFKANDTALRQKLENFKTIGAELASASEAKATWIDVYSALYQALPKDSKIEALLAAGGESASADPVVIPFEDREALYIEHIDSVYFDNLATWFTPEMKARYDSQRAMTIKDLINKSTPAAAAAAESVSPSAVEGGTSPVDQKAGWVIEISGHHFHNSKDHVSQYQAGVDYLRQTLIETLATKDNVKLPVPGDPDAEFSFADIGIFYPTIVSWNEPFDKKIEYDPLVAAGAVGGSTAGGAAGASDGGGADGAGDQQGQGGAGGDEGGGAAPLPVEVSPASKKDPLQVKQSNFVVQMAWVPRSPEERLKAREARLEQQRLDEEARKQNEAASANANTAEQ